MFGGRISELTSFVCTPRMDTLKKLDVKVTRSQHADGSLVSSNFSELGRHTTATRMPNNTAY